MTDYKESALHTTEPWDCTRVAAGQRLHIADYSLSKSAHGASRCERVQRQLLEIPPRLFLTAPNGLWPKIEITCIYRVAPRTVTVGVAFGRLIVREPRPMGYDRRVHGYVSKVIRSR